VWVVFNDASNSTDCTTLSGTVLENSDLNRMHKEVAVDCFAMFLED
jgi:hypothetical protein